jgi:acyl-CoA synthetase (AMP-forming)/AMP-acid ligase II
VPQGATLSHGAIAANTRSIVQYLELGEDDRVLALLPFYYVYGKSLLNTHACCGGSLAIENRFLYPNVALDTLEREQCTGLSGVPSTFAILLNRSTFAERAMPSLRYVTQAGGAMSPELARRLAAALPGRKIFIMYGATEASARLSYLPPERLADKPGSIGIAIPGVELRVLDADGNELPPRAVGELVARGENLMSGYWGDPEATARALDRHGYHTGDLAWRDEEGFFYISGRIKDIIKAGAHRISAKEIEDAIAAQPEVHETAVIGVPDEVLGERIKAFVVLREGVSLTAAELEKALRPRLASYKLPGEFAFVPDLPKNESGKVMKRELR